MKSVVFRLLRRIKKTNKITVASYIQWRNVFTSDYSKFSLTVDNEYTNMPLDELVYNHEGELLFWHNFNPDDIPVFGHNILFSLDEITANHANYAIRWAVDGRVNYNVHGLDCDGIPTFSHYTCDYIAENFKNMNDYDPLTVGVVVKWFGWFLYQLQNSYLHIGK